METSADKALRMPELVACVLRCLGPLDWLKCAAVCSSWSVAILDGGEPRTPDSRPSSSPEAEGDGKGSTRERDREAGTTNLWRDFAVAEMRYDPAGGGSSDRGGGACNGGRSTAPVGRAFYRSVCLEGDPEVLGPPLAVTSGEDAEAGSVALVRIGEVAAAAFARSRKPRALLRFLMLWMCHGRIVPTATGDTRRARTLICDGQLRFRYPRNFGWRCGDCRSCRDTASPAPGSAAYRAAQRAETSAGRKNSISKKKAPASVHVTSAMMNDGLGVFTRLLVLCSRCRRPCTTIYASKDEGSAPALRAAGVPRRGSQETANTSRSGGGLTLWIECQGDRCGLTRKVEVDWRGPCWLVAFAKYVLHHTWEDVNTLESDHGTEWFSDTSPEGVQRRQEEARAISIGLDALASRGDNAGEEKA